MTTVHRGHDSAQSPTPPTRHWLPLGLVWLVVLLPAMWGITQTVLKSMALFR